MITKADGKDQALLAEAVDVLRSGGVIAHATEGVWGIACDPWCTRAVEQVLTIKQRDWRKGLILVGDAVERFRPVLARLTDQQRMHVLATWPGPVTWLLPNHGWAPTRVTGGGELVAVRVSAHLQVKALAAAFGGPLVSTSANTSGDAPARSQEAVIARLGSVLDFVLPGQLGGADGPSEIRSLSGQVVRS